MKKLLVAAVIAWALLSHEANAQERAGSAALGAVSGAVVLGPVGAVAGALIGYTAGPAIAHSWGVGHSAPPPRARRVTQAGAGAPEAGNQQQAAAKMNPLPIARPVETGATKAPPPVIAAKTAPPVQGFE